jgi:tol-pal system protein YbgF
MQMAAELRILQEQTQQLALTLAQLAEAIKAINGRIEDSNKSTQKQFADQAERVKTIGTDLSVIREGTQGMNTRIGQLRDEVEALRGSLTSLPAMLSQLTPQPALPVDPTAPSTGVGVPSPIGASPTSPVTPPPPSSTLGLSPTRMFEQARSDYHAGQFTLAVDGFEQFLRQFPNAEYSDDAHFYIGESYFSERRFEQAIAAYNRVIQNFPKGDQVPMALYKRGVAQGELGQTDAARASFELVIKLQPNSPEAGLAKQNLDRMARRQTPAQP